MSNTALVPDAFDIYLKGFHSTIENNPPVEKVKKELLELKEMAALNNELTFWQKDAIIKRCENYINGTYGSTSKEYKVHTHTK